MYNFNSPKSIKEAKRVGRGIGSRKGGHTVGRGQKGQKSRSGYKQPRKGFEGGSMPLSRRLPKLKGFSREVLTSGNRTIVLNVCDLDEKFAKGEVVNTQSLVEKRLIKTTSSYDVTIKILANGEITKAITVEGLKVSESAKSKIIAAGGEVK